MLTLAQYDLEELLSEGKGTSVYRGKKTGQAQSLILKMVSPTTSERRRSRLREEYAVLAEIDDPGVVRVVELVEQEQTLILVEEDIGGQSLARWLVEGPLALADFFPIALALAEALEQVHRRQIVHRDINPRNIVWNRTTGRVQLIDFGLASRLLREQARPTAPDRLEGSLPYLAPEQTGRMNRVVDYRADFYAVGATFYELLTGERPFTANDALEWVHCHLARTPRPPAELNPKLPQALSDIVVKLLAKLAEDRYQSAQGLRRDLEHCFRAWRETGKVPAFVLAQADASDRFQLPQKLYGREREVARLLAAQDRVAGSGQPEVVLVAGYSGVGKSALVAELHKPIVARRGYFVSGKFDQYQRGIPYASLAAAFQGLIQQVLTESEERVAHWRQRLLEALAGSGQVIVDLVPQVALIIGPQPAVPELPPDQAQHRLHALFQRFVGVFASAETPLALFLDDLQWIDAGSLKLLGQLSISPHTRHLLVLGAYRDNEVTAAHPVMVLLDDLRKAEVVQETITLAPLTEDRVREIVADTLHCELPHAALLADLVFEKTHGNPFFCFQFLTALYHDGLLFFDHGAERWHWHFAEIVARNFTDNVVALMLGELQRLPVAAQQALTLAGFLGNEFPLEKLALVSEKSAETTTHTLWPALRAGLIMEQEGRYRFLHDRVQEAAYALTPPTDRPATHLHIGRLLLRQFTGPPLDQQLFEVVAHLNPGAALLVDPIERHQLAELNLQAAGRARAATVYDAAVSYLAAGLALLPEDAWTSDYELAFALHLARADNEYLAGNFTATDEWLGRTLAHAQTPLDRARAYLIQISLGMARGENPAACDLTQVCLEELGLVLPAHPTVEEVQRAHAEIATALTGRPLEQLLDLPRMTDPAMEMALRVLVLASTAAIFTDRELWSFQDAQMVLLCLRYGNSDASVMAYLFYGFMLGAYLQRYRDGYRFCEVAYTLMERSGQVQHRGNLVYHQALAALWVKPVSAGIAMMKESIPMLIEYGNLVIACLSYRFIVLYYLLKGSPLEEVSQEAERCRVFAEGAPYPVVVALNRATQRLIRQLRAEPEDDGAESGGQTREDATDRIPFVIVAEHLSELAGHYIMGRFAEAHQAMLAARPLLWAIPGLLPNYDYFYYGSLALAAGHAEANPEEQAAGLAALQANEEQLRIWAEHQPETFASSHLLVRAEIARLTGRALEAIPLYDRAVATARTAGFTQHEALAAECAARFYESQGAASVAEHFLRTSYDAYFRWGAVAKLRRLEEKNPQLRTDHERGPATTISTSSSQLDVLAAARAAQAISGQIVREKLLATLLEVVLQQAGAQFGALLLTEGEQLTLTATARVEEQGIEVQLIQPHSPAVSELPVSILNYVRRTGELVLLGDAHDPHAFAADEYLQAQSPRSVLCLPILRQNAAAGALYLEHRTAPRVFTLGHLAVLEQIAAQAAISLENAHLFAQSAHQAERLKLLGDIDHAILAATSLHDICGAVLQRVSQLIPVRRVSITLYPKDRQETVRFAVDGGREICLGERVSGVLDAPDLFPTDRVALVEDLRIATSSAPIIGELRSIGIVSVLSAPLVIGGSMQGRLNFSAEQPGTFTAEHQEIAGQVAAQLAIAMQQQQLHEKTRFHAFELEQRVNERTAELRGANEELEAFGYSVSHDLRAPLRTITGFTALLVEKHGTGLDPEAQRYCSIIHRQTERMAQLIDDLLSFSRWSRAPLRRRTFSMTELVTRLVEELVRPEDLGRLDFQLDPLPDAPGDPSLLTQVWSNLISNALKYSSKKERSVVRVTARTEDGQVVYQVADNGAGFDMRYAAKLFGVFKRMHAEKDFPGTGVGLAIVRRIVERHGGRIWADSKPNEGATFSFALPDGSAKPEEKVAEPAILVG